MAAAYEVLCDKERKDKYDRENSNSTSSKKSDPTEAPISLYQELKLDDSVLYREFEEFLLTREQLRLNGFPESSPNQPGRAVIINQRGKVEPGARKRTCCRCRESFEVLPNRRYRARTPCKYHGGYVGTCPGQYHVTQESCLEDVPFVKSSKRHSQTAEKFSKVFALDCEMVYTTAGMEVVQVGVVGINGLKVFDSFVLPQNPILDYNTRYSGVTEKDLRNVSTTLADVQANLLKLFDEDTILCGHGLENDLKALRLIHDKVVDTSVVFPHPQERYKKSLKNLASEFLGKTIQSSRSGHDCFEDARTCLELMFLRIREVIKDRPVVIQDGKSALENPIESYHYTTTEFYMTSPMQDYHHVNLFYNYLNRIICPANYIHQFHQPITIHDF